MPDGPDQPLLPFDPPLAASPGSGEPRPEGPELGGEILTARLFEEFARRAARLERHPSAKPTHAA